MNLQSMQLKTYPDVAMSAVRRRGFTRGPSATRHPGHVWAVILAGGEGSRLATLTRDPSGQLVPKQFCSLAGGQSLVDEALSRASFIAPRERNCIVVSEKHRHFWNSARRALGADNVVEQPLNRGTGIGVLLALTHILKRDPNARIVLLPADHYVKDEATLGATLRFVVSKLSHHRSSILLVGIKPQGVDPDMGYVVPAHPDRAGVRPIKRFVEKPDPQSARMLITAGAVWNSFILAADGSTLLKIMSERLGWIVPALWSTPAAQRGALYRNFPNVDFSRDILQGNEGNLLMVTAPDCGWNDLGTPSRLARVLAVLAASRRRLSARRPISVPSVLNLALQFRRLKPMQPLRLS